MFDSATARVNITAARRRVAQLTGDQVCKAAVQITQSKLNTYRATPGGTWGKRVRKDQQSDLRSHWRVTICGPLFRQCISSPSVTQQEGYQTVTNIHGTTGFDWNKGFQVETRTHTQCTKHHNKRTSFRSTSLHRACSQKRKPSGPWMSIMLITQK